MGIYRFRIDDDLIEKLRQYSKKYDIPIDQVILSAAKTVVYGVSVEFIDYMMHSFVGSVGEVKALEFVDKWCKMIKDGIDD